MSFAASHGYLLLILFMSGAVLNFAIKASPNETTKVCLLIALVPLIPFVWTGGLTHAHARFPVQMYYTWIVPPFMSAVVGILISIAPRTRREIDNGSSTDG